MAKMQAHTYKNIEQSITVHLKMIDDAACDARKIDASQFEIYQRKLVEANAGGGSMLQAESELLNVELSELCESVLAEHDARDEYINKVELARIKAKSDVRKAMSASAMHAIVENFKVGL